MSYSKEVAEKAYQLAFEYEANKGSCSQCVLAAIMDTIGGIDESVFKAAQGLSGGTVSCGTGTCGALAGGITILGSRVGRTRQEF
ncbi:MAG TPA: C-GCAxxG-C-C family protein, partial [Flexilinea sp.]|nr:C-GCAxxG-C-C family protein [Flexilinea sp.]